jgi:hypothetical protein
VFGYLPGEVSSCGFDRENSRATNDVAAPADWIYMDGLGVITVVIHLSEGTAVNAVLGIDRRQRAGPYCFTDRDVRCHSLNRGSFVARPAVARLWLTLERLIATNAVHTPYIPSIVTGVFSTMVWAIPGRGRRSMRCHDKTVLGFSLNCLANRLTPTCLM